MAYRTKDRLRCELALALVAGFSITTGSVGFAMPVQDGTATGVIVGTPRQVGGLNQMDITGANPNNVINWKDFSIAATEKVNFANTNNYANIVTGRNTSLIDGHLTGGGKVYLINPNGVIFGAGSVVNVGELHVSTKAPKTNLTSWNGTENALLINSNGTGTTASDVVNLGSIQASKVEVTANSIRFLDSAQIQDASGAALTGANVNLTANDYIHVGNDTGTAVSYTANKPVEPYKLVHDAAELSNIRNATAANYMLASDIDGADGTIAIDPATSRGTMTPIPTFSGKMDGMFFAVKNLDISGTSTNTGLFGTITGNTTIENMGLDNVHVKCSTQSSNGAGGFVGTVDITSDSLTLKNVYNINGEVTGSSAAYTSGLVGKVSGPSTVQQDGTGGTITTAVGAVNISSSYNASAITGSGILGNIGLATYSKNVTIADCYNDGTVSNFGIISNNGYSLNLSRVYDNKGTRGKLGNFDRGVLLADSFLKTDLTGADATQAKKYKDVGWDITDTGGVEIDANGNATKHTWRLYPGQSLPILTAFLKGSVQAEYNFTASDTPSTRPGIDISTPTPNLGTVDVAGSQFHKDEGYYRDQFGNIYMTYNARDAAIPAGKSAIFRGRDADFSATGDNIAEHRVGGTTVSMVPVRAAKAPDPRTTDPDTTTYSHAIFSAGQQGYDVVGGNFTVIKRKIILDSNAQFNPYKEYDGTSRATITNGVLNNNNFQAGDRTTGLIDGDDVTLNARLDADYYDTAAAAIYNSTAATQGAAAAVNAINGMQHTNADKNLFVVMDLAVGTNQLSGTAKDNYDFELAQGMSTSGPNRFTSTEGVINPRKIQVKLNNPAGATKVYDGTTDVDASRGNLANYEWASNVAIAPTHYGDTDAALVSHGTGSSSVTDNISIDPASKPVYFDNANASAASEDRSITYAGISSSPRPTRTRPRSTTTSSLTRTGRRCSWRTRPSLTPESTTWARP